MIYSLNVYGKDSEIVKTVGSNFVPVSLFIKALEISDKMKEEGKTELESFELIIELVLGFFPELTRDEILTSCDIGDVINCFKQIIVRANEISKPKN